MSCSDLKKSKRRRSKKISKTSAFLSSSAMANNNATTIEDHNAIIPSTDIENDNKEVDIKSQVGNRPNPYLKGEQCILCHCFRPHHELSTNQTDDNKSADLNVTAQMAATGQQQSNINESMLQVPLWVCPDCRRTVEEEESRTTKHSVELDASSVGIAPELESTGLTTTCTCDSCKERRELEAQHKRDTAELQQKWLELRYEVSNIYKLYAPVNTCCSESPDEEIHSDPELECIVDRAKVKELVNELCVSDPHQLFQRLESQCREFVIDMKKRLLAQLKSGHATPTEALQFVTMLLDNYGKLKSASDMLGALLVQLEHKHLSQFNLTWDIHITHLYQSIVYTDPLVQKSLPILINQLRKGGSSRIRVHEDLYASVLHRYLKYDGEMSVVMVLWRDCEQLLEKYNDEQATLKAKQKMLKEDWEFFKAQRKILESHVLKNKPCPTASNHAFETHLTEAMRQMLQRDQSSAKSDQCRCPDCKCKRCNCDECAISHYITCGLINPDVREELAPGLQCRADNGIRNTHNTSNKSANFNGGVPPWEHARYILDVHPPSMSSTSSSESRSSPVPYEHEEIQMAFEDCTENFEGDELADALDGTEDGYTSDESDGEEDDSDSEDFNILNLLKQNGDVSQFVLSPLTSSAAGTTSSDPVSSNTSSGSLLNSLTSTLSTSQSSPLSPGLINSITSQLTTQLSAKETGNSSKEDTCDCEHCTQLLRGEEQNIKKDEFDSLLNSKCQCYSCLSNSSLPSHTLPPHNNPTTSAATLHLYPHIHGQSPSQPPPLLPKLYELHNPTSQVNLLTNRNDLLHYSDWDNSSPTNLLNSQNYNDLLGANHIPPLLTSNPFVTDPIPDITAEDTRAFFRGDISCDNANGLGGVNLPSCMAQIHSNSEHVHTDACFKNKTTTLHTADVSLSSSMPHLAQPRVSKTGLYLPQKSHSSVSAAHQPTPTQLTTHHQPNQQPTQHNQQANTQHSRTNARVTTNTRTFNATCSKESLLHENHSAFTVTHKRSAQVTNANSTHLKSTTSQPQPPRPSTNRTTVNRTAVNRTTTTRARLAHKHNTQQQEKHSCGRGLLDATDQPQCHDHKNHEPPKDDDPWPIVNSGTPGGCCASSNAESGAGGSCEKHHHHHHEKPLDDELYDSIDEGACESAGSNGGQKDSKYCDCCYCEFFGHSGPPVPPTSRNYMETRDRLRLQLKKRTEGQEKKIEAKIPQCPRIKDQRPVEDLLKFINGDETSERGKRKDMKQDKKKIQRLKLEKQMEDQERIDIARRKAEVNERLKRHELLYQHKGSKAGQNDNIENQVILQIQQGHQPTMIKLKEQVVQLIQQKQPTSPKKQSKANVQNVPKSGQNSPKAGQNSPNAKPAQIAQKIVPNGAKAGQNVKKSSQTAGKTISNGPKPVTTQSTPTTPQKCRTDGKPAPQQLKNVVQAKSVRGKKGRDQEAVNDVCNMNGTVDSMEAGKHKTSKHDGSVQRGRMESPARATHNADATHLAASSQLAGRKSPLKAKSQLNRKSPDQENHKKKLMHKKSEDIDTIFLPRDEVDDADEFDQEIEAFKRFCLDSSPVPKKEKVQVNANLKDILIKKKMEYA